MGHLWPSLGDSDRSIELGLLLIRGVAKLSGVVDGGDTRGVKSCFPPASHPNPFTGHLVELSALSDQSHLSLSSR